MKMIAYKWNKPKKDTEVVAEYKNIVYMDMGFKTNEEMTVIWLGYL